MIAVVTLFCILLAVVLSLGFLNYLDRKVCQRQGCSCRWGWWVIDVDPDCRLHGFLLYDERESWPPDPEAGFPIIKQNRWDRSWPSDPLPPDLDRLKRAEEDIRQGKTRPIQDIIDSILDDWENPGQ